MIMMVRILYEFGFSPCDINQIESDGKKLIRVYKILQKSCMDMILLSDIRSGMSTSFTVLYSNLDR